MVECLPVSAAFERGALDGFAYAIYTKNGYLRIKIERDAVNRSLYWLHIDGVETATAVGESAYVYAIPTVAEAVRSRAISEGAAGYADWVHGA